MNMAPARRRLRTLMAIICLLVLAAAMFGCSSGAPVPEAPTPTRGPSLPAAGIALGVYQPSQGMSGNAIDRYTTQVGRTPAFAWLPATWQNLAGDFVPFDAAILEQFRTRGIMPGLTWNPSRGPVVGHFGTDQPDFSWTQITSGRYDDYLKQFATAAARYGHPFMIRMLHEMDGTWYPWAYRENGNTDPANYVAAWRHIVDVFRQEGASNVQFVWSPSVLNAAALSRYGDTLKQMYPGDGYVDWVALDGYANERNGWGALEDRFAASYDFVTGVSQRPVMLFEVGSSEHPGDPAAKAAWITQGFLTTIPQRFPRIRAVNWFNSSDDRDANDYRIDTSPESLAAWMRVVADPRYEGRFGQ
jgi:hypothetical protein